MSWVILHLIVVLPAHFFSLKLQLILTAWKYQNVDGSHIELLEAPVHYVRIPGFNIMDVPGIQCLIKDSALRW